MQTLQTRSTISKAELTELISLTHIDKKLLQPLRIKQMSKAYVAIKVYDMHLNHYTTRTFQETRLVLCKKIRWENESEAMVNSQLA